MPEHGETDGERARGLTGESEGAKRALGGGRARKINPFLRHVHKFHVLFIGCYTETDRKANEKFRRELRPLLLLETAALRAVDVRVLCVENVAHERPLSPDGRWIRPLVLPVSERWVF